MYLSPTSAKLFFIYRSISAFSGANRDRRSSYICPAPENNLSDGTLVGGHKDTFKLNLKVLDNAPYFDSTIGKDSPS